MFAGVIEGFFGPAWGWGARRACLDFLAASGFHFYVYAPKSEGYLRRRWREPLPSSTAAELAALAAHARATGLEFGVGLTPFELYREYDERARIDLKAKVRQLDELGVDMLCILFDDMRGDVPALAALQCRIVADIRSWSHARRHVFCPTYYSDDPLLARVFGAPPAGYLEDLGRMLDADVDIFWTGQAVCSDCYPAAHLSDVAQRLRRRPFIWDNNLANDSKLRCRRVFLNPDRGRWQFEPATAAGMAINPMNQPLLSRIALCGYGRLLGLRGAASDDCFAVAGPRLGPWLRELADQLSDAGLDMPMERLVELRALLAADAQNPLARELQAWLDGDYAFDPACLTE